jgi:hypothetical protein
MWMLLCLSAGQLSVTRAQVVAFFRTLGGAVGVAIYTAVLVHQLGKNLPDNLEVRPLFCVCSEYSNLPCVGWKLA